MNNINQPILAGCSACRLYHQKSVPLEEEEETVRRGHISHDRINRSLIKMQNAAFKFMSVYILHEVVFEGLVVPMSEDGLRTLLYRFIRLNDAPTCSNFLYDLEDGFNAIGGREVHITSFDVTVHRRWMLILDTIEGLIFRNNDRDNDLSINESYVDQALEDLNNWYDDCLMSMSKGVDLTRTLLL